MKESRDEPVSNEDSGISPVVGAILMVAITVVLAAVILFFITGLADQPQAAQAGVQFDETPSGVEVLLNNVNRADEIRLVVDGTVLHTWGPDDVGQQVTVNGVDVSDELTIIGTVGDSETVLQRYQPNRAHSPALTPQLVSAAPAVCTTPPASADIVVDGTSGVDDGVSPFNTISAAVTAASPGDTVWVAGGTYNEQVAVTKDLTIQTSCAVMDGGGSLLVGYDISPAVTVTIEGFEMRDYGDILNPPETGAIVLLNADGARVTVRDVSITGGSHGVHVPSTISPGQPLTMDNVTVSGALRGYYSYGSDIPLVVQSSTFESNNRGMNIDTNAEDVTIQDSRFISNTFDGVYHTNNFGTVVTIQNTTFENNGDWGYYQTTPSQFTLDVSNSQFETNGGGIQLSVVDSSTSRVQTSTFIGNALDGIRVSFASPDLDATNNWWGQSTGAAPSQYSGDVDVSGHCTTASC